MTIFTPSVQCLASFAGTVSVEALSREVEAWGSAGCYAASPEFVRASGGPISRDILWSVPESYFEKCEALGMLPNIDVRIHRLNVGEYPAVPGWHCDGALRETFFAQPDVERIRVRDTVLATVSTDELGVSNFEILDVDHEVEVDADEPGIWRKVDASIPEAARRVSTQDGVLYQIGAKTLHRCSPARVRGWRLFFRMSMWHRDYLGAGGKKAYSQQVYVTSEGDGW